MHVLNQFVIAVVLWLLSFQASAMMVVSIDQQSPHLSLGEHLEFLEDATGRKTFASVSEEESLWQPSLSQVPNFGYTDSAYWFRVRLQNTQLKAITRYLDIRYPLLDDLQIYIRGEQGSGKEFHTGDTLPHHSRPLNHREFIIPLAIPANQHLDIYIRMHTQGAAQLPIFLSDPQSFFIEDQSKLMGQSIYYGIMVIMVLYNLFLFFSLRERAYLYYVGFVFSFVTMLASMHGVIFQHVFPGSPYLHELFVLVFVPSTMLFSCLFTQSFLNLEEVAPWLHRYMQVNVALSVLCIVGAFFLPYSWSTRISVFLVIPASLMIFVSGPYAWMKGQKSARFFTVAWLMLLVGTTLAALNKFGFIPRNFFTENGLQFGSAIEAALLSFALADRFNREREARYREQRLKLIEAERREKAEQRLIYQATHNAVNGFPNGILLREHIDDLLNPEKEKQEFALVLIHLKRFHEINKTLGHNNADYLLRHFSQRLNSALANLDSVHTIGTPGGGRQVVASLEGVTFAAIFDIDNGATSLESLLRSFMTEVSEPIAFQAMNIDVGVSVGVAIAPEHGKDATQLQRSAQIALDMVDHSGKSYGVYSPDVNPYSARRLSLMGELRKAIDDDSLELHFQPQMCFKNHQITGLEALIRWNHPVHGFIPPDEFIPIAEKTGIITPLTAWVIDRALKTTKELSRYSQLDVSVNISAVNLREEDFVQSVKACLQRHNMSPTNLVLEITESSVMTDPEFALSVLNDLKNQGIKLSIDDFGTGHSSLSYIKRLPVHEIKIDRSFVMDMNQAEDDRVIVETTLNMCHSLGYKVVAEGIENEQTFNALEHMHCDYAQGYFLARPLPKADLIEFLKKASEPTYS